MTGPERAGPGGSPPRAGPVGDDQAAGTGMTAELAPGTAAANLAAVTAAPEVVASSVAEYARAWWQRVRGGDAGVLPVVIGLVAIVIIFQSQNSVFLSAGNITNLLVQGTVFILLGMAEVFVLLLGEIDLSIGYVAGVGAVTVALLIAPPLNLPWFVGVLAGLAATTAIGILQGTLVTRMHIPSFVVTLAGLLGWEGVLIYVVDTTSPNSGGVISVTNPVIFNLVNGNMPDIAGWLVMAVAVAAYGTYSLVHDGRRRRSGLSAPPLGLTVARVGLAALVAVVLVLLFNSNRGTVVSLKGMPPVIPAVVVLLVAWTFLLNATRFGRYVQAIGGNAEAARRAGINLARIRTAAFAFTGLTAGLAGIVYESRLGSISIGIDGGTLVLYAVAAAVIGGASLFGGRGKPVHALLGGIVIAAIYNGMGLLGLQTAIQYMVTALVLIAAVSVDRLARRGRAFRSQAS